MLSLLYVFLPRFLFCFFFNDTATTEIYTLSLHDALPISPVPAIPRHCSRSPALHSTSLRDRKSTRLNSSHLGISYAVFCLKKQKIYTRDHSQIQKKTNLHERTY